MGDSSGQRGLQSHGMGYDSFSWRDLKIENCFPPTLTDPKIYPWTQDEKLCSDTIVPDSHLVPTYVLIPRWLPKHEEDSS